MTHANERLRVYAGLLAERIHVIEFQDGPHLTGLVVAPRLDKGRLPRWLTGLAYWSEDGHPHFARFNDQDCSDVTDLDPVALVSMLRASDTYDYHTRRPEDSGSAGRMPQVPGDLPGTTDLFEGLGWGVPLAVHDLFPDVKDNLRSLVANGAGPGISGEAVPYPELAYPDAAGICARRIDAAKERFVASLTPGCRNAMTFMREALPVYDPDVLHALLDDPEESVRDFARRHPLLAMRSLADPEVASLARGGDLEGALRLSMRPELVGRWVLDHWMRHPKSADAVDGRCRGKRVDEAVGVFELISRDHLPIGPAEFADCVDVCNWTMDATSSSPFDRDVPAIRDCLTRARGRWSHVVSQVRRIAPDMHGAGRAGIFREVASDMFQSFRWDLFCPSIQVAGGGVALQGVQAAFRDVARQSLDQAVARKGMGLPDLIRMLDVYRQAKPAISAVDRHHVYSVGVTAALPDYPWFDLGFVDVRPVRVSVHEDSRGHVERAETPGYMTEWVALPAAAPRGMVYVEMLVARKDGRPASRYVYGRDVEGELPEGACPCMGHDALRWALTRLVGEAEGEELGARMARLAGIEGLLPGLNEHMRSVHSARLADMVLAWRPALPRRLRGRDGPAFARVVAEEYAGLVGASGAEIAAVVGAPA